MTQSRNARCCVLHRQVLQQAFRTLAGGKRAVETSFTQRRICQHNFVVPGHHWKDALDGTYVWFDYFCIPQPGAGGSATGADHRFNQCEQPVAAADCFEKYGGVVAALQKAVRSIPAYVERSVREK